MLKPIVLYQVTWTKMVAWAKNWRTLTEIEDNIKKRPLTGYGWQEGMKVSCQSSVVWVPTMRTALASEATKAQELLTKKGK